MDSDIAGRFGAAGRIRVPSVWGYRQEAVGFFEPAFRADHPGAKTVHIGNGRVSDTCGALAADVAFAKDSLALELQKRGVAFEPFETLRDVIPRLQRILDDAAQRPAP